MSQPVSDLRRYNLALLGFGNVGQAFAQLLTRKKKALARQRGVDLRVVGIATGSHGQAVDPQGLPLSEALKLRREGRSLETLTTLQVEGGEDFIRRCGADVLLESTPVNYQTGEPALSYLKTALESGMHAVTANKGPVVHGYRELDQLAVRQGLSFYFESTVMDGAPVFSLARCGMPGAKITGFQGVLNSTTNLILTRMESGETQEEAVAYAQSIGIAETDPSGDVDGWDAAVKVAALVTVLMDIPLTPDQVDRTGIRGLTLDQVQQAAADQQRWKLVCTARKADAQHADRSPAVTASVAPQRIDVNSPLYQVSGTSSVLQIESDVLGTLSLREEDPTPLTTAYGLLADTLNALAR